MPTYTVRAGDTLGKIARRFSVSMDGIMRLNNIRNPDGTVYEPFDPSYWAFHLGVK